MSAQPATQLSEVEIQRQRVNARLNDIRMQPMKQLPMTIFMMWMVGNDVSIFSIMFVGMAVINPLQSAFAVNSAFSDFEEDANSDRVIRASVNQSKWIYIGCSIAAFCVAMVKLTWMGLLPVNSMDWMSSTPPSYGEYSTGAFYD